MKFLIFRYVKKFTKIKLDEKILFIIVLYYSFTYWLQIRLLPYKKYTKSLGTNNVESDYIEFSENKRFIEILIKSIKRSSKVALWESKCMNEALVAKKILNNKKIASTIYIGVAKESSSKLKAHAWVRCGKEIIVGRKNHEDFKIVATIS